MISWLPAAHIAKRIAEAIGPDGWLHTGDVRARRVPQRGRLTAYEDQVVGRGVRTESGAMVLDVHLILDNSSTHKMPAIQRWLLAHPRFIMRFTPTSSSWLNLVERWFAELTTKKLRRGTHRSVRELNSDIRAWISTWNGNPRPSSGPRPPTKSSTRSPAIAPESVNHNTSWRD